MSKANNGDLYQGSFLSKVFGFIAFILLIFGFLQLLILNWAAGILGIVLSVVTAHISYRLARRKRSLGIWRDKDLAEEETKAIEERNRRLDSWARSVPITEVQQSAMWELWQTFKANKIPKVDPLAELSDDDREYIKKICSADYRPAEFGSADILRTAQFLSLLEEGYTPSQAAVIVGMTINRVGRKDIMDRNVEELRLKVHSLLSKYIKIHDYVFKASIRRKIPLPPFFESINFKKSSTDLLTTSKELNGMILELDRHRRRKTSQENKEMLVALADYACALQKTVQKLISICDFLNSRAEKKKKQSLSVLYWYSWFITEPVAELRSFMTYRKEIREYEQLVQAYLRKGKTLNRLFKS